MTKEQTLSIIKPDATRRNLTGAINTRFEQAGLRIVAQKRLFLTKAQAEAFYGAHRERSFFGELCDFMISGPVIAQVLEGENAIVKNRDIMGATNPANAAAGTIARILPNPLKQTLFMVPTLRKQLQKKSLSFSASLKLLAKPFYIPFYPKGDFFINLEK